MKPFCSGGLDDVNLLQSLQPGEISDTEMNPFYFKKPVAPLVALKKNAQTVPLSKVVESILALKTQCEILLVEGSGGLMVPLGRDYMVADLIRELRCKVIVAARNRLGTINHTLLTVNVLRGIGVAQSNMKVVLMKGSESDPSCRTNKAVIENRLKPIQVHEVPFLGNDVTRAKKVILAARKMKNLLQKVTSGDY